MAIAGEESGKSIVLLSDGTGNSAAALWKTNIWRLYQALDLSSEPPAGEPKQVALYDDGVGTSSFRPLALMGGAFGFGLKRNVLDLYRFLCRTYQPGDRIYAFGFSRGAFTIRVAVGLIAKEGVLTNLGDKALARYSVDAYRELRREFTKTGGLVRFGRWVRDWFIAAKRKLFRQPIYANIAKTPVDKIRFVGVFDTVAAYGMPVAELTRGIDNWLWPLSMPDYVLSPKVENARHALALDDERDTFHPLVWDELAEASLIASGKVSAGRMQQVWFNGAHSDVGGGYPNDALSYIPLLWMIGQAEDAALRFVPDVVRQYEQAADAFAPLHDSRRGLASYYRLQPRKLSAKLNPPDPRTLLMQNPDLGGKGLLNSIKVHQSVMDRIEDGTDRSAPIVLPANFDVVWRDGSTGPIPATTVPAQLREDTQEWVWNEVWKRRWVYFLIVGVSLFLAALPLFAEGLRSTCIGPTCLISPMILFVGSVLPSLFGPWIKAWSLHPGLFLIAVAALGVLLYASRRLQYRIQENISALWRHSLGVQGADAVGPQGLPDNLVYRLRTSRYYQSVLRYLKWSLVPNVFGILVLVLVCLAFVAGVGRVAIESWSLAPSSCRAAGIAAAPRPFATSDLCWKIPEATLTNDNWYKIRIEVTGDWVDSGPWQEIETNPTGFGRDRFHWSTRHWALLWRRSLLDRWFQPMVVIVPKQGDWGVNHTQAVSVLPCEGTSVYVGYFLATRDGDAHLFVNDAIIPIPGLTSLFYGNNGGTADVTVVGVEPGEAQQPSNTDRCGTTTRAVPVALAPMR